MRQLLVVVNVATFEEASCGVGGGNRSHHAMNERTRTSTTDYTGVYSCRGLVNVLL